MILPNQAAESVVSSRKKHDAVACAVLEQF
jgi:hypothetical protein